MKVFLTGATGYIGAAVARALRDAGHEISGLTHSADKAPGLERNGVSAVIGDLKTPSSWRKAADAADVLIHTAFDYKADGPAADKAALEALIASAKAAKSPRLLVYTSGVWLLGKTSAPADEQTPLNPLPMVQWRTAHEKMALSAAGGTVSAAVIRPGCVYGGRAGLYAGIIQGAVEKGEAKVVGDGSNCWAAVYVNDLAELYRLVVAKRPDKATYHASDGAAEPLRDVAESFLKAAGRPGKAQSWPIEQARKALGPFADALALDQRVSSAKARNELGWTPTLDSVVKNADRLVAEWKGEKA